MRYLRRPMNMTPSALTNVLDDLGVLPGERFVVSRYEPHDTNRVGGSRRTDPATSANAALKNLPRSGSQRDRALVMVAVSGDRGCTRDELQRRTGIDLQSLSPRISELKSGGWIEAAPTTRPSDEGADMEVYILTQKGRLEFALGVQNASPRVRT